MRHPVAVAVRPVCLNASSISSNDKADINDGKEPKPEIDNTGWLAEQTTNL